MTIVTLFHSPRVVYQTADEDVALPEAAIAGSVDNGGLICLSQEGRDIIINKHTVPDLCRLLRLLAKPQE